MSSTECRDLGRALCIITGASRGFGQTIARNMSRLVKPGSVLVLVARSGDDLRALQAELAESEAGRVGLVVECVVADLGQPDGLEAVVRRSQDSFSEDLDHIILVNNAGKKKPELITMKHHDENLVFMAAAHFNNTVYFTAVLK